MRAADVEAHVGRVAAIEAVAVDAALELGVLNERMLVEGGKIALINAHFAPYLIARLNKAVA